MSVVCLVGTSIIAGNAYLFSVVLSENHDKAVFMLVYGCQNVVRQLFGICHHDVEYIYQFDLRLQLLFGYCNPTELRGLTVLSTV